jgi:hypothetical protein
VDASRRMWRNVWLLFGSGVLLFLALRIFILATMMDAPLLPPRDLREQPVMLKGRRTKAPVGSEAFCFVLAL